MVFLPFLSLQITLNRALISELQFVDSAMTRENYISKSKSLKHGKFWKSVRFATPDRLKVGKVFPTFIKEASRLQILLANRTLISYLHLELTQECKDVNIKVKREHFHFKLRSLKSRKP